MDVFKAIFSIFGRSNEQVADEDLTQPTAAAAFETDGLNDLVPLIPSHHTDEWYKDHGYDPDEEEDLHLVE